MMRISAFRLILPMLLTALASSAAGHVTMIYPTGSEVFGPGQSIEIEWRLDVSHNQQNWDLYFSPDSGNTWEIIQLDISTGEMTYAWTVPDVETQTAMIQIVQDNQGFDYWSTTKSFSIASVVLSADEGRPLPTQFSLSPNYPNPFNPASTIRYELPVGSALSLIIYDVLGREVTTLAEGYQEAGSYQVRWDGAGFPSGIYVARLVTPEYTKSIKMVLLK